MDDAQTWKLIHAGRTAMAETLGALTPGQWNEPSLCGGWSVQIAAGHVVAGAEQTKGSFARRMVASGFRFNAMIDSEARRVGAVAPGEIVERLRKRTTTTNRAPAPVMAMLGEIVVHGEDIRRPLDLHSDVDPEAVVACLDMYSSASFPVGSKKRIAGLRLVATDLDWSHGDGPEVSGPGLSLLMAMTGRPVRSDELAGAGSATILSRLPTAH